MASSDCVYPRNETIQPVLVRPLAIRIVVEACSKECALLNVLCIYKVVIERTHGL